MRAAGGDFSRLKEGQRLYREIFAANPLYKVTVFDGMRETLEELKKRHVKLAVLSNKPHEATCLAVRGLFGDDIFDVILCASFLPSSSIEPLLTCNTAVFQYTLGYIVYNHASWHNIHE